MLINSGICSIKKRANFLWVEAEKWSQAGLTRFLPSWRVDLTRRCNHLCRGVANLHLRLCEVPRTSTSPSACLSSTTRTGSYTFNSLFPAFPGLGRDPSVRVEQDHTMRPIGPSPYRPAYVHASPLYLLPPAALPDTPAGVAGTARMSPDRDINARRPSSPRASSAAIRTMGSQPHSSSAEVRPSRSLNSRSRRRNGTHKHRWDGECPVLTDVPGRKAIVEYLNRCGAVPVTGDTMQYVACCGLIKAGRRVKMVYPPAAAERHMRGVPSASPSSGDHPTPLSPPYPLSPDISMLASFPRYTNSKQETLDSSLSTLFIFMNSSLYLHRLFLLATAPLRRAFLPIRPGRRPTQFLPSPSPSPPCGVISRVTFYLDAWCPKFMRVFAGPLLPPYRPLTSTCTLR
ncbi:hypothetical protein C8Q77DRAFT_770667 [Trametes polyzona]|nr:hypothetical protein C8Q77DRAFT_770667 [Trametes polyzona]